MKVVAHLALFVSVVTASTEECAAGDASCNAGGGDDNALLSLRASIKRHAVGPVGQPEESKICSGANSCELADPSMSGLSPLEIAKIWLETTTNLTGAKTAGGAVSCVSAVSIALGECEKVVGIQAAKWTVPDGGVNIKICNAHTANGIWQITNSVANLSAAGCGASEAKCNAFDPCCNARMAYYVAKTRCTATTYGPHTCKVNNKTVTEIPLCQDVKTPNMPCYDGPFCTNTQIESNDNAPYYFKGPHAKGIDECFAGLKSCPRPATTSASSWSGWGAPYDYYHNTFCCITKDCGVEGNHTNWNCFLHGQTDKAYACPNCNPFPAGADCSTSTSPACKHGKSNVKGRSTPTYDQMATAACKIAGADDAGDASDVSET